MTAVPHILVQSMQQHNLERTTHRLTLGEHGVSSHCKTYGGAAKWRARPSKCLGRGKPEEMQAQNLNTIQPDSVFDREGRCKVRPSQGEMRHGQPHWMQHPQHDPLPPSAPRPAATDGDLAAHSKTALDYACQQSRQPELGMRCC